MITPQVDDRSPWRRAEDERIASEPQKPIPHFPDDAPMAPAEQLLAKRRRRPLAVAGIVENGVVRPLDPTIKLTELSQVMIVSSKGP